ncbi:threonine ammonia-lyase [Lichenifustis flavocetrariae]|uniref:Threonine/serine dehydratase n=1 Tax=Lichenifustis flavocetrariae TaxID=2949735 RepID=A0AA42CNN2_9HYPH|nr:threonine/serine dehydratase [Lichenifustis flavocetrariae]MCW6509572.1 threonine/serine dehydratase [Lichenifustis flavocetrariae]
MLQDPLAIDFADIQAAAGRIAGHAVRTPLLSHPDLDARTGGRVFLKAEPLQRTGSFKFRGAFNRIAQIDRALTPGGVVAFSSGNHGQAVAATARHFGLPATIVMPADAPAIKVELTRSHGATIVLYDRFGEDRAAIAARIIAETGAVLVPPYDDPNVIAGQGTVGLEIMEDLAALGFVPDLVLCCCGGGGLIAGVATAVRAQAPEAAIYAVEPEAFDDTARSLASGTPERNAPGGTTICDAIVTPTPGQLTFPINRRLLAGGLRVSDDEVRGAVVYAIRHLKVVVEPGGAVALAALLAGKIDLSGKVVVAVLSGGNMDGALLSGILAEP